MRAASVRSTSTPFSHSHTLTLHAASESSKPSEPPKEEKKETEESAAPPKEKKDQAEPADQQVDKQPPGPPTPSAQDKKADAPPLLNKGNGTPKKDADKLTSGASKSAEKPKPVEAPKAAAGSRGETRVKMNRMRLRIAERLKESQNAAASLTTFNEIDMSSLMEMRKKYKDEVLKTHDVKFGFMSAFAKASTLALKEIPMANASIEVRS